MTQTPSGNSPNRHIYLASRSPRRRELLVQIGVCATPVEVETDETRRPGESPEGYVQRVALEKARAGRAALGDLGRAPVLAADTAVVVDDDAFGKPTDRAAAIRMLGALSGRTHRVLTAVALLADERARIELSDSRVTFRVLTKSEMISYWETGEPCDKAGAYAIQGLGALFVADLQGSYSGVMGLPLYETGRLLEWAGLRVLAPTASVDA